MHGKYNLRLNPCKNASSSFVSKHFQIFSFSYKIKSDTCPKGQVEHIGHQWPPPLLPSARWWWLFRDLYKIIVFKLLIQYMTMGFYFGIYLQIPWSLMPIWIRFMQRHTTCRKGRGGALKHNFLSAFFQFENFATEFIWGTALHLAWQHWRLWSI